MLYALKGPAVRFALPPFLLVHFFLLFACNLEGKYERDGDTDTGEDTSTEPSPCTGTIYEDNFDSINGFFVAEGTRASWDWGMGSEGLGCRNGSCWSTNPWGSYNQCEDSTLTSPRIDLSVCAGTTAPLYLTYWHWYDFEWNSDSSSCNDGVAVEFSPDGGTNWEQVEPEGAWTPSLNVPGIDCRNHLDPEYSSRAHGLGGFDCYGTEETWERIRFIIPAPLRTNNVRIRFIMGSTYNDHFTGYTFDELSITASGS